MSDSVQSPGRVRAQAIVLLLLAFLAGAFAGGAIERLSHGRRADWPSRGGFMGGMARGGYGGRGGGFPAIYDSLNLSTAQRLGDFLELAHLMAKDALDRTESCGGHFRMESQTPEGEAQREAHVAGE